MSLLAPLRNLFVRIRSARRSGNESNGKADTLVKEQNSETADGDPEQSNTQVIDENTSDEQDHQHQQSKFDSLPLHVLATIFAHIQQVDNKIRLRRVCQRFKQCVDLKESWKFNDQFSPQSVQECLAFLKHAPGFTVLKFAPFAVDSSVFYMLLEVEDHAHKFKPKEIHIVRPAVPSSDRWNGLVCMERFFRKAAPYFESSLEVVCLLSDHNEDLAAGIIQNSHHLQQVTLNMKGYGEKYPTALSALHNKPLTSLTLIISAVLRAERLSALINSVPGHTLSELRIQKCWVAEDLSDMLVQLVPSAAAGIRELHIEVVGSPVPLVRLVQLLPARLPNLESVTVCAGSNNYWVPEEVEECDIYVRVISIFLVAMAHRAETVDFNLMVRPKSAPGWYTLLWWNAFDLLIAQRTHNGLQEFPNTNHWQRIIQEHNTRVFISYDTDD